MNRDSADALKRMDLPDPLPDPVRCDFGACGWTGEPDDDCYYVLGLEAPQGTEGLRVLLWDEDEVVEGDEHILALVARLERYENHGRPAWRARPEGRLYRGPRPW